MGLKVPDMSYGKESVPVSCVNSLDNNYSEYIEYSTKRLPQKDVHINLDDGFLTCCDCQDDCQVWPLIQFYFVLTFCEKSLICTEGKFMTPSSGRVLFCYVPFSNFVCYRLGPLKGYLS